MKDTFHIIFFINTLHLPLTTQMSFIFLLVLPQSFMTHLISLHQLDFFLLMILHLLLLLTSLLLLLPLHLIPLLLLLLIHLLLLLTHLPPHLNLLHLLFSLESLPDNTILLLIYKTIIVFPLLLYLVLTDVTLSPIIHFLLHIKLSFLKPVLQLNLLITVKPLLILYGLMLCLLIS